MRRNVLMAAVLLTAALVLYWIIDPAAPSVAKKPVEQKTAKPASPMAPSPPPAVTVLPIATEILPLNSPETSADEDLGTLELLLAEFAKHHGGNPVGENMEFAAALLGNNPKHLAYLPAKGPFLDSSGQLIDRWGTPYFFHQQSATRTEITSAGPDRQFHTADDLVR